MKKFKLISVLLLALAITANVYAVDFSTVNSDSIKVFIKMFPEYRTVMEKHGEDFDSDGTIQSIYKFQSELDNVLKKYGLKTEEFASLTQKVTMGYSAAQMKSSGMDPNMMGFLKMTNLSAAELAVIDDNISHLDKVFAE